MNLFFSNMSIDRTWYISIILMITLRFLKISRAITKRNFISSAWKRSTTAHLSIKIITICLIIHSISIFEDSLWIFRLNIGVWKIKWFTNDSCFLKSKIFIFNCVPLIVFEEFSSSPYTYPWTRRICYVYWIC